MAKQVTMTALKNAAIKSGKLTAASAAGLMANNYATEKFHTFFGSNTKIAKILVSGAVGIGLPFLLEKYGKVGNVWTDGIAAGAGLRLTAEVLKFLDQPDIADMLNPLQGGSGQVVEIEVESMEQLQRIQDAAQMSGGRALSGPQSPAIPYDLNMTMQGRRETESVSIY